MSVVLIGVLGGIKGLQINRMIARGEQYVPPPETVTAAVVKPATWPSVLTAVGSLEAVQGVMVTAELTGKVRHLPRREDVPHPINEQLIVELYSK